LKPLGTPRRLPSTAAGIWEGVGPDGRTATAFLLSGNDYIFYSAPDNPAVVTGLVYGAGIVEGRTFSMQEAFEFNFNGSDSTPARLEATLGNAGLLRLAHYSDPDFDSARHYTLVFNPLYFQVPLLGSVTGAFEGELLGPGGAEYYSITVDEEGSITATGSAGCSASGNISPRLFEYGYTMDLTFTGATCALPDQTFWGTAVYDPDRNWLLVGLTGFSNETALGLVFYGHKVEGFDFDGDGLADSEDADDDNDGVDDPDDDCPRDTNRNCPHTVLANGLEWLQPSAFSDGHQHWSDINRVCRAVVGGVCQGTLEGLDLHGWTWASSAEVRALFNAFGFETAPPEATANFGLDALLDPMLPGNDAALAWEAAGWRPSEIRCDWACSYVFFGFPRDWIDTFGLPEPKSVPGLAINFDIYSLDARVGLVREFGQSDLDPDFRPDYRPGAWFYRTPEHISD